MKKIFQLVFLLVFILGGISFYTLNFSQKVTKNSWEWLEKNKADTIIILTGGRGRIDYGINIFKKQKAKRIFITGVHEGHFKLVPLIKKYELPQESVHIDPVAKSTKENIMAIEKYVSKMEQQNFPIKNLILVSSDYHLKRIDLLLKKSSLKKDDINILLLGYPTPLNNFQSVKTVIKESFKGLIQMFL